MPQLLKNNVSGVLSALLGPAATSMTLVDATNWPAPAVGEDYLATLIGINANGQEYLWEIVKVTAKAGSTLTVVRAQEGTTAQTWPAATTLQMRLTAASVMPNNVAKAGDTMTGKLTLPAVTTSSAPLRLSNPATSDVPSAPENGDVWINNNGLQFRQGSTTQTVALLGGTQTFTGATTYSGTLTAQSNVNLGSNSGAATHNLGHGATTSGNTKAINIGTNGLSGSTTNITLGSSVSGATNSITLNGSVGVSGGIAAVGITAKAQSGEGGQVSLNNTADTGTIYSFDVDSSNHGRLFTTVNDTNLSIGQLGGNGGQVKFFIASSELVTIASTGLSLAATSDLTLNKGTANGVLYLNGSKVATSGSALTFDGNVFASRATSDGNNGILRVVDTAASTQTQIYSTASAGFFGTVENKPVVFLQTNTEQMRLTSTGLGIGTTPSYRLQSEVAFGTVSPSSLWRGAAFQSAYTRSDNSDVVVRRISVGATNYASFIQAEDAGLNTAFLALNPNGGNVGVGTSSPAYRLDVRDANSLVQSKGTSGYGSFYANGATGSTAFYFFGINDVETARISSQSTNYIAFSTNDSVISEKMRITQAGNVGIGTADPGAILHTRRTSAGAATVGAFLQNSDNTAGTEVRLAFAANTNLLSSDRYGWIGYVNTGGTNGGALTFATTPGGQAAQERMRLNADGNLLFQGGRTIGVNSITNSSLGLSGGATFNTDGASIALRGSTASFNGYGMEFYAGGSEKMRLDSSGNLGLANVPYAGGTGWKTIDISSYAAYAQRAGGTSDAVSSWNAYIVSGSVSSGTGYRYKVTGDVASAYEQNGGHRWYVSGTTGGTAGAAISFTQAMAVTPDARLYVNFAGTADGYRLRVGDTNGTLSYGAPNTGSGELEYVGGPGNVFNIGVANSSGAIVFRTNNGSMGERARITNGGLLINSATSSSTAGWGAGQLQVSSDTFAASQVYTHNGSVGNTSALELVRSRGSKVSQTIVGNGDDLGVVNFVGYDGATYRTAAAIYGYVDGTPGASDMPGRIEFHTTPDGSSGPLVRATISNAGSFGIGVYPSYRLHVRGSGNTNATYAVVANNSSDTNIFAARDDGYFTIPFAYNNTTASAANAFIDGNGGLIRSTSSLRYKKDVAEATHGLAEVLQLRPVVYKGKSSFDGNKVFGGLIAEEVHAVGLTEFVDYDADGQPDALHYGHMVSLLTKAIQEQQALITALTARVAALEAQP